MNANDLKLPIRDIDTALLRAFIAVAESGSMTVAANRLNVTQGAVSQRIKRLEDLLQKTLFDRAGQRLDTTIEGEKLIVPAQKLIALNDEVFTLMTAPEFSGTVRFGVPYDIVFPFVGPILKSFASAYPKVSVELEVGTSEDLKNALSKGRIDLTLTTENHTPKGAERLIHNELIWVGGRGGDSHLQTPLPLVIVNENCMFRMPMLRALERVGREWRINVTRNMDASFAMLSADLGVTAILDSTVPSYVEVLGAEQGLPDLPVFYINLYTSASGANEIASGLAQHIRDQFTQWRKPPRVLAS